MGLFGKQLGSLLMKDFKLARNNKKATAAEFLFPIFMGILTGFFMLLVTIIQNMIGGEYSDVHALPRLDGVSSYNRWVGYSAATMPSSVELALHNASLFSNGTLTTDPHVTTLREAQLAFNVELLSHLNDTSAIYAALIESAAGEVAIAGANFVDVKHAIKLIMRLAVDMSEAIYPSSAVSSDISMQMLYIAINLRAIFSSSGCILLIYAFIPAVIVTAGRLVDDKRVKARETLKVMGCSDVAYLLANGLASVVRMAISIVLIAFILAAFKAIKPADIGIVAGVSLMFALTLIAFAQITPSVTATPVWANVMCIMFLALGAVLSGLSTGWPIAAQYLLCLLSPVAFFYGILPSLANGSVTLQLSPGDAVLMLAIDFVLYVLIGNYIYAINPGEFGVPKHPLFFLRWIWASPENAKNEATPLMTVTGDTPGDDELVAEPLRVVLQNLNKYFGSQRDVPSVDSLSISIKKGEIYALLGHNGAGKTTTISILTGMITPTSYDVATVNGHDISEQMDRVRESVGLCPQFDVLFNDLSARDHLELFAGIKGVQDAAGYIEELLNDLELPLDNQRAETFSGGMKRRLSVGNAIVGGASLLFLDEPSSGMDPLSRRRMWDLLKRQKQAGKTIVLTTHFMEEADYLGDRIAIMSKGRLFCCETSSALKVKFGTGFKLVVAKGDGFNSRAIEDLISEAVGQVKVVGDGQGDAMYELPAEQLGHFPKLLRAIEGRSRDLGIANYGVQMNTLEDVFVNISAMEEERIERERAEKAGESQVHYSGTEDNVGQIDDLLENIGGRTMDNWMLAGVSVTPFERFKSQVVQVFQRKWTFFKRSRRVQTMVAGFPLFFLFFAFVAIQPKQNDNHGDFFVQKKAINPRDFTYVAVTPRDRDDSTVLLDAFREIYNATYGVMPSQLRTDKYDDITSGEYLPVKTVSFIDGFKSPTVAGGFVIHHNSLTSAKPAMDVTVMWNPQFDGTFTAALTSMIRTAAERVASGTSMHADFVIRSERLEIPPSIANSTSGVIHLSTTDKKNVMQVGIYMVLSIGQIVASLAIPMSEDISRSVYHTTMAQGMMPLAYFVGNLAFDLIVCVYPFILFVLGILWKDIVSFYSGALPLCIFAGMLFCTHVILQAYIFVSYMQGLKSYVYTVMVHGLNLSTMGAPYLVDKLLQAANFKHRMMIKPYLLSLFPSCSWYHIIDNTSGFDKDQTSAKAIFTFKGICTGWGFVFLAVELVVPVMLVWWFMTNSGLFKKFMAYRERKLSASTRFEGDNGSAGAAAAAAAGAGAAEVDEPATLVATDDAFDEDADVKKERGRVEEEHPTEDMVLMTHLRKQYGTAKVALKDLSLGVGRGECFGLLGPNGAGKSTACKLILNQIAPTAGCVEFPYADVATGTSIDEVFRRSRLGVCQQSDTLWEYLSAEEHMEEYLRLRLSSMYDAKVWRPYIAQTLKRVKLDDAGGKQAGGFSGGMKRKLQVCLAMYTGSKAVFLDEPSTGMDPFARRALWKVILDACSNNACVVLTTHSMDEAEAVCGRIGIITHGRLRCLGTTQHLKARFGRGYVITVAFEQTASLEDHSAVMELCRKQFGSSFHVKEQLGQLHRYGVDSVPSLADAFSFLEEHTRPHRVEQYSVTQTASLEEIFLGFVTSTRDN